MAEPDISPRWPLMSAAERAEAYSPSTMVSGDLTSYLIAYRARSDAAYAALPETQTLSYGAAPSQTLDMVMPQVSGPVPLHVFIHGGYWQELSKKDSFFAASGTLSQGIAFAALDYTLAPEASLEQIVAEVANALRYLRTKAHTLGVDHARIILSGSSAGAHLAAMATLISMPQDRPAALILLSGIYDLRPLLGTYVNDALDMDEYAARQNSPALQDATGFPPSLIAWAAQDTDEFKHQSRQFAQILTKAGCDAEMLEVPKRNHFDIVHDLTGTSALAQWLPRFAQGKTP